MHRAQTENCFYPDSGVVLGWLTESDFRGLGVATSSEGLIYAWLGNAGIPRLTESDFSRLEVALSSLGIGITF